MKHLITALLLASAAHAQGNGSIDGPVLGMVFDADAGAVRMLEGIPGSARLGRSIEGVPELATAAAASGRGYAIGVQRDGRAVVVTGHGARALDGARAGAGQTLVSPRGTSAALVFGDSVQVFTGMPEAPELKGVLTLGGRAAGLALSDDGEVLLAIERGRRGGDTVYAHRQTGATVFYRAARVSSVAFVPGRQDALVAEPRSVKLVRPDLGAQPIEVDAGGRIAAAAASADGLRVFVASSSGRVAVHDLASGATKVAQCACSPRSFVPLRGSGVFRLEDAAGGPMWVLDGDATEPRIAFVAADGESR